MKQGDEYEEEAYDESSSPETGSVTIAGYDTKMSKKTLIIIGAIGGAVIILLIVFMIIIKPMGESKKEIDGASILGQTEEIASEDVTAEEVSEEEISEETPKKAGFLAGLMGKKEPEPTPEPEPEVFEEMFGYTEEELMQMQALNITQEDIDVYLMDEVPFDTIYNTYVETRAKAEQDILDKINNPKSPEYKALFEQTYLSLPINNTSVNPGDIPKFDRIETYNCRYEKIKNVYGNQPMIKIDNLQGLVLYINIPITRYVELEDAGNILMDVSFSDFNDDFIVGEPTNFSKVFVYYVAERKIN